LFVLLNGLNEARENSLPSPSKRKNFYKVHQDPVLQYELAKTVGYTQLIETDINKKPKSREKIVPEAKDVVGRHEKKIAPVKYVQDNREKIVPVKQTVVQHEPIPMSSQNNRKVGFGIINLKNLMEVLSTDENILTTSLDDTDDENLKVHKTPSLASRNECIYESIDDLS
jgi:hypothetical protein